MPSKTQCLDAHLASQKLQVTGQLVAAREQVRTCTSLACPGPVVSDCARWLSELEQRIPSVVFEVRLDKRPNLSAVVSADGNLIKEWTRGEALRLDPGEHTFKVELPPNAPITETVMLSEGMRYRVISVEFRSPALGPESPGARPATAGRAGSTTAPAPQIRTERPIPIIVYPLLGVGALGAAGFAGLALSGQSEQRHLEKTCAPSCTDSQLSKMRQRFLLSDVSLGIGAAGLIGAGVLYLARPEQPITSEVGFVPLPGGGAAFATRRF